MSVQALRRIGNALGYALVAVLLAASFGSALMGHPLLLEVEKSNSMFPLLQRGDVAIVLPLPASMAHVGTIVLYQPTRGALAQEQFIVHRIVGGNAREGYITKGDHNAESDQAAGATTRVPPAWIKGIVPTVSGQPLRIPLVGYAALWAGGHLKHLLMLPLLGAALVLGVALLGRRGAPSRRRRHSRQDVLVVALLTLGLVLSVLTGALVLATSEQEVAPYMVGHTTGVLNGSQVGMLTPGQVVHITAAHLYNTGFFPLAVAVSSPDRNMTFTPRAFWLPPGGQRTVALTLRAEGMGMHKLPIWVGLFPPLLPPNLVVLLAERSYWLALGVVALMPLLPILAYLAFAPALRRAALRLGRRALRPLTRLLALS